MAGQEVATIALALTSACLFAVGNALEHSEAQRASPEKALRPGLLVELVRRRRWVVGMAGDAGAWVLQALALSIGSLVFVQPMGVLGLVFGLPLSATLNGRRLSRRDWASSLVLATGLAVFLVDAAPSGGIDVAPAARWAVAGPILAALVIGCVIGSLRATGAVRALLLGTAAGTTFGVTSALTKAFVHELGAGIPSMLTHWEPYLMAALILGGLMLLNSAYQVGSLKASLPAVESLEPVVAVILGLALLEEGLDVPRLGDKLLVGLSVAAMLYGILSLTRSEGELLEAEERAGVADGGGLAHPTPRGTAKTG